MKPPLEPPDSHYLSAASGWLGLDNWREANDELDKITPQNQSHPSVISVRFEVYSKAGKWDAAAEMADRLVSLEPHEPGSWIALAYATRRKPGGGILQAREILLPAQTRFPEVWLIPYNLACYECQLGNQNEARTWLDKAFAIGDPKTIKMMALADPDLEPLRGALGETEI